MNGISEWIVGVLLLPVTVFIFIPLAILTVWLLAKLLGHITHVGTKPVRVADCQVIKPKLSFD